VAPASAAADAEAEADAEVEGPEEEDAAADEAEAPPASAVEASIRPPPREASRRGRKRDVGLGFGRLIRRLAGGREGEEAKLNWWWIQLPAATSEAGEPTAKRERGSARSTALVGPTSQPVAADWVFFLQGC